MVIGEKMKKGFTYIGSGSAASLISGLYARTLPWIGADITGYGFPLSWLKKIASINPYYHPPPKYFLSPGGLLTDIVFWSLIIGASVTLYERYKSRK